MNFCEDYTDAQLNALYTKQLMYLRDGISAKRREHELYAGTRCCELCHEYIGASWATEIKPRLDELDLYLGRIKKVLSTREHIPNKAEAKMIRKALAKFKSSR